MKRTGNLKRCKMPKNIKIGDVFYKADAHTDPDTGKVEIDITEHHVRSIRRKPTPKHYPKAFRESSPKYVTICEKSFCTWGKVSKKNGDFGWLPGAHKLFTRSFSIDGAELPLDIWTTKQQALTHLIARLKNNLDYWKEDIEVCKEIAVELKYAESRLTRLKNSRQSKTK